MSGNIYENIYMTTNYDQFIILELNRPVSHGAILKSISEFNMLPEKPILVTKNMEVLDGQHRLAAARKLGLEIYYTIARDVVTEWHLGRLNTQINWTLTNFLKLYSKSIPDYQYIINILDKYKCPNYISTLIHIIGCPAKRMESNFRRGEFKLKFSEKKCDELLEKIFELKDIIDCNVRPFAKVTAISLFALSHLINTEDYVHETAKRKFSLSIIKDKLKDAISWANITNVEGALKEIYNSRQRDHFLK